MPLDAAPSFNATFAEVYEARLAVMNAARAGEVPVLSLIHI